MTPELSVIITVGVALAGLILGFVGPAVRDLRRGVADQDRANSLLRPNPVQSSSLLR